MYSTRTAFLKHQTPSSITETMAKRKRNGSPPSPTTENSARPRKRVVESTQRTLPLAQRAEPAYNPDLDPHFTNVLGDGSQRINLGIDFGTSSCAAYFAIVPEQEVGPLDIKTVKLELQRSASILPTFVALKPVVDTEDAVLIFGRDINTATELGEISWNDVWIDVKQADFLIRVNELPVEKQEDIVRLHKQHMRILEGASKYRKIILRHGWMKQEEIVHLNTMEDVVDKLLRYFLMEIKAALRRRSVLSREIIDDLLSGGEDGKYGDRARVGVAIPEVWTWQRMVMYRIFRNAGFHEKLELLSEGRCALAQGIKDVIEEQLRSKNAENPRVIRQFENTIFVGIDDGGYTLVSPICIESGS